MDSKELREIGKRIQLRRKQMGLTQESLAEMMNVSIQMVSNLERGNKAIKIDNLINLSKILKISTDYILMGTEASTDRQSIFQSIETLNDRDIALIREMINCLSNKE